MTTRPTAIAPYIKQASDRFDCKLGTKSFFTGTYIYASDGVARPTLIIPISVLNGQCMVKLYSTITASNGTYLCSHELLNFRITAGVPTYVTAYSQFALGTMFAIRTYAFTTGTASTPATITILQSSTFGTNTYYNLRAHSLLASDTVENLIPWTYIRRDNITPSYMNERSNDWLLGLNSEQYFSNRVLATATVIPLRSFSFANASTYGVLQIEIQITSAADQTADNYALRVFYVFDCTANGLPVQRTRTVSSGGGTMGLFESFTFTAGTVDAPPRVNLVAYVSLGVPGTITTFARVCESYVSASFA